MNHSPIVSGPSDSISPGLWPEDIDAFDHDLDLASADRLDRDVGHDEQIAGAGVLQLAGHMQVGVMRAFRIGMRPMRSSSAEWASKLKAQAIRRQTVAEGHAVRPVGVVLVELGDRLLIGRCR